MVRIADLIKGKLQIPAPADNGQADTMRFSEVSEPVYPDEKAELLLEHRFSPGSKQFYLTARNYLQEVREKLLKGQELTMERPLAMIDQMIAEPSLIDELYHLTLTGGQGSDMYIASPINSMIYSFKIGVRMGYTQAMLAEIALAALHHDIGMFLIPEAITRKDGKLTDAEFSVIKKHTETGRDCFARLGFPDVRRAIYEHHERENGKGYPAGLKSEEICEYAMIIGICDSYEAMTHDRPHKKAAAQYRSVLQLADSKDNLFAPHIVKIFLDVITLYPIGSYVCLNNKAVGIVVSTNPNNPMKPTVRIVFDGQGNKVTEEKLINLAESTILTIVTGIAADEIAAA
jgi:HD-GYP domain-containing protein (c-di-GMP phosphodiesterase class II)